MPIETTLTNAATIYGLNLYLLTLANPVGLGYNGHTIATNINLAFDPPSLNKWQLFWLGPTGQRLASNLFLIATLMAVLFPAFTPYYLSAVVTTSFWLGGATVAGYQSAKRGKGLMEGFANYITNNWAQSVAISMAVAMVTFGVSQLIQAVSNAGSKAPLANSVIDDFPKDRLELHNQLTERGFKSHSITDGGYVKYTHADGRYVWIKDTGEVITYNRVWLPDGSKKIPIRYYWDGTPVPITTHSTDQFVEPFKDAIFIPIIK